MKVKSLWNDQIPEKDGVKSPINDICISPDGTRVVVAVGNRVLLYRAENGDLIESLRGHKETVHSVSFSNDSTRFASGGADNIVVIWKVTGQGLLKYNHTAPIQRVKYNPSMLLLASCSEVDFGLWTPDQKQVTKEKVPSRILSASWSPDGSLLAIGMLNGMISLRNQQAQEVQRIERKAPIWCLQFIPDTSGYGASGGPLKPTSLLSLQQQGQGTPGQGGATPGAAAVSSAAETSDLLAVGCWDKTYSLYRVQSTSHKLQTVKQLDYYPCSISYSSNTMSKTSYLIIAGSNKKATLYNKEGARLTELTARDSWLWCCDCNGELDVAVLGTHHGYIDYLAMDMGSVHAVFRDRYAYRENLTEVIVHHLLTDKKVRIKCKDLIQNLSLYRNKLAVQLSDRICVYESSADNTEDMHFRIRPEKIMIKDTFGSDADRHGGGNLMAICTQHLLFCRGKAVELYTFDGLRQKVWQMEAPVTCIKVDGGLDGKEGLLLGLQSGGVFKVFVDNPFPIELSRRPVGIKQIDINIYRTTVAIVDSQGTLTVTDLQTQEALFTTTGVAFACFNSEVEDLICVTNSDSSISVINGINSAASRLASFTDAGSSSTLLASTPEVQEQHIFGLALGFRGQKIFCLYRNSVMGVDVPQGLNMQRALEHGDIKTAYNIACLGATEADWKLLAMRSLRANFLSIAKNAFSRLKETKFLSLIDSIERRSGSGSAASSVTSTATVSAGAKTSSLVRDRSGGANAASAAAAPDKSALSAGGNPSLPLEFTWLAELMAYEGHHQEAAKIYARNGRLDEAIRLFTDLRRWEDAKMFARNAGQADVSALTLQQAKWLQEINDWKGASEMYMAMGQFLQAAKIIAEGLEPGWQEAMIEVVRACPGDSLEALDFCGDKFSMNNETQLAKETYTKSKDVSKLMALYARKQMWKEAAKLADENEGKFDVSIFLSYAEWLVSQDRYEEAMQAYKKSRRLDLARRVLEELTNNAVAECRFKDAAYYYWLLSRETEDDVVAAADPTGVESKAEAAPVRQAGPSQAQLQAEYEHKADLYYAYASVHAYVTDPFTSLQPEMLFQVARFIINSLGSTEVIPFGVSKASTMYTLARQAMLLGAYKLARHAYDRLSKLTVPERKQEEVELDMLLVQAKPVRDDPDHLPVCYRCGSTNPLLNPFSNRFAKGDVCTNCGHPFVRSFINFDILPLVEFVPDPSISDEEAVELIRQPPPASLPFSTSLPGGAAFSSAMAAGAADSKRGSAATAGKSKDAKGGGWKESKTGGADLLSLGREDNDEAAEDAVNEALGVNAHEADLFTRCLNLTLERQKNSYTPVKVDANTLLAMRRSEVYVCRPSSKSKRATFYKNMLPEIPIAISQPCHRFFHLEDFEFSYLSEQRCPYSRLKSVGEYGSL